MPDTFIRDSVPSLTMTQPHPRSQRCFPPIANYSTLSTCQLPVFGHTQSALDLPQIRQSHVFEVCALTFRGGAHVAKWSHDQCYGKRRSKMAVCRFLGAGRNYSPFTRYSFRRFVKLLSHKVTLFRLHIQLFALPKRRHYNVRKTAYSPFVSPPQWQCVCWYFCIERVCPG